MLRRSLELACSAASALARLRQGDVDVVAVAPPNAIETIRANRQATFTAYHREIDPIQADYVQYFCQVYIDEVNRRVLSMLIQQGTAGVPNAISPEVLVSPFKIETKDVSPVQPTLTHFLPPR